VRTYILIVSTSCPQMIAVHDMYLYGLSTSTAPLGGKAHDKACGMWRCRYAPLNLSPRKPAGPRIVCAWPEQEGEYKRNSGWGGLHFWRKRYRVLHVDQRPSLFDVGSAQTTAHTYPPLEASFFNARRKPNPPSKIKLKKNTLKKIH
jgi:hypothetical protein